MIDVQKELGGIYAELLKVSEQDQEKVKEFDEAARRVVDGVDELRKKIADMAMQSQNPVAVMVALRRLTSTYGLASAEYYLRFLNKSFQETIKVGNQG